MKTVLCAGHICLDITPTFPPQGKTEIAEILTPGKLIQMGNATVHTGGSVSNTGLAMKLLGADVSLLGKVGRDAFGEMVGSLLHKYDADEGLIVSDDAATSYSVVLAIPGIDRIFLHHPGANHTFLSEDIPEATLRDAALLHFGYPPLMESMYRDDGAELVRLMKRAKTAGVSTSLDLAAVDPASPAGKADWNIILKKVLPYVDFFEPSVEELCCMLAPERLREWQSRANGRDVIEILDIERDVAPLADTCMAYGAKVLLIKCGAAGMYYRTADEKALNTISPRVALDSAAWAARAGFEESYVPDRILSGTGAGDTSIAAFLTAMLEGKDLKTCIRLAAATGTCCVSAYDALSGLLPLDTLQTRIDAGWAKNERK